jgi:hypothetical protein
MNAPSRRKIEMGRRALEFSRAHPDSEPGSEVVVARLEQLVARANEVAAAQRDGLIQVRSASARKRELRREMLEVPIAHLAEVGRAASATTDSCRRPGSIGRLRKIPDRSSVCKRQRAHWAIHDLGDLRSVWLLAEQVAHRAAPWPSRLCWIDIPSPPRRLGASSSDTAR